MVKKFRKKPVVIEAIQLTTENAFDVDEFVGRYCRRYYNAYIPNALKFDGLQIQTLEGAMLANIGDWIIKGINGEFYPCKPDIFEKTYDPAE
jgi:hypothetical protein